LQRQRQQRSGAQLQQRRWRTRSGRQWRQPPQRRQAPQPVDDGYQEGGPGGGGGGSGAARQLKWFEKGVKRCDEV
jgi:hypothetical protein